jgi:hypothetical protein
MNHMHQNLFPDTVRPVEKPFVLRETPQNTGHSIAPESQAANDQEKRIQAALGLARGPLPAVRGEWLSKYHRYLTTRLLLPFEAQHVEETGLYHPVSSLVTVTTLVAPDESPEADGAGLICRAYKGTEECDVPLVDLEVEEQHPNYQLLEDYWYWIWNWRFDPQI